MQTKNNVFLSIFSSVMDWTSDGNNNSKEVYMLQIFFLTLPSGCTLLAIIYMLVSIDLDLNSLQ